MSEPLYPSFPDPRAQPPPAYEGYPVAPGGPPPADPLISRNFDGWWQRGVAIAKAHWRPLLTLQLIGVVVALALRGPAAYYQAANTVNFSSTSVTARGASPGRLFAGIGFGILSSALAVLVTALVILAIVRVTIVAATGGQPSVGDALRGAVRRVLPLIGWQLLAGLITVAGFVACILPGIYLLGVFLVLPVVVALERGGVIVRCFKLFHGNLGASVARVASILGITLAGGLVAGLVGAPFLAGQALSAGGPAVVPILVATAIAALIQAGLGVLLGPLTVLAYADMRARIEPVTAAVLRQELDR